MNLVLIYTGMLVFGTCTAIFMKVQLDMTSIGVEGVEKSFAKPWFENNEMFFSMMFCVIVHQLLKSRAKKQLKESLLGEKPLSLTEKEEDRKKHIRSYFIVLIPSAFDLVASGVMTVGLLYTTVSVMQMMRGSMVIFSAILSIIFLKRKLNGHHWAGISLAIVAICVVGTASVLSGQGGQSAAETLFGCALIVVSQFIQAAQVVAEEFLMKKVDLQPMLIVGMEGVWGMVLQCILVIPICWLIPGSDAGSYENTWDTFVMLGNNMSLLAMVICFMLVVMWYNVFGMLVTFSQSAIHRTILEAARTGCIWVVDLGIYYWIDKDLGERWDAYSLLQLVGFAVLILAMAVYNNALPFLWGLFGAPKTDEEEEVKEVEEEAPVADTTVQVAEPAVSPTIPSGTPVGKHSRRVHQFKPSGRQAQPLDEDDDMV